MRVGVVETFVKVIRLGRLMYPGLTLNGIKHQVILLGKTLLFFPVIRKWFEISDNPLLVQTLKRFPLINGAIYWPYINHVWPMKRRLSAIDQHFRMLGGSATIIAHATFGDVELARLDEEYPGLRFVFDKAEWFVREGEIVLNLFVNDQRYYSIAFTLGIDGEQSVVFIGALQGANCDSAQGVYRDITHALYGMRPRDLLMVTLKLLCGELGIRKIWAVSGDNRQHRSAYFGYSHSEKVHANYNEVWLEHFGVALANGFYDIPTAVRHKEMSEIPTRKRAVYRRRYAMLDKLALDIRSSCASFAEKPLKADG